MSIAQQDFSFMSDQALQQAMQFAQRSNNTPTFLGLMAEMNKRKQTRTAAQGQQAQQQPTTVADQIMSGIANLSSGDHEYADGGIVAFAEGGQSRASRWLSELIAGIDAGKAATDADDKRSSAIARAQREQSTLEEQQAKEADTANSWLGAFATPEGLYKNPAYSPQTLRESRNYGNEGRRGAPAAADLATANSPAAVDRAPQGNALNSLDPEMRARRAAAESAAAAAGVGGARRASAASSASGIAGLQAPTWQDADKFNAKTAEDMDAASRKMAEKDNTELAAAYAPMRDKLSAKRTKLADETADSEGILGLKWGNDKRKAMRDIGLALLASKESNFGTALGGALQKGAEGYESAKAAREGRADKLDEAENQMRLAEIAAKQGNVDRAAKHQQAAEVLRAQVYSTEASLTGHKNTFAAQNYATAQHAQTAKEQMRNAKEVANISHSASARLTGEDKYIAAAMRENPKMTYTQAFDKYVGAKGVARPLSYDTALTQFQKGLKDGIIPTGTNFATWYQEQLDGSAAPSGVALPSANAIAAELAKRKN